VFFVTCSSSGSTGGVSYRFDFGDGTPASSGTSRTRTHTYLLPGDYVVTLTVSNSRGETDSESTIVRIL
jgi:PKD repeat protein